MTTISGRLERITYQNEANQYTIAKLKTDTEDHLITVVGYLVGVRSGECLNLTGSWVTHPRYGPQFQFDTFEVALPVSLDGILNYLRSGVVKGIGRKMADRLVRRFKEQTLDVIENNPTLLLGVEGIGAVKAENIRNAWQDHHAVRKLMHFLQEHGVKAAFGSKILGLYGQEAIAVLSQDPYRLAIDLPGAGFVIADKLARQTGIAADDPKRVKACIDYLVETGASEGHTYVPRDRLLLRCYERFAIDTALAGEALTAMVDAGDLVLDDDIGDTASPAVYGQALFEAESGIARRLEAMLSIPLRPPAINQEQITTELLRKLALQLSDQQLAILQEILSFRVAAIAGGPGTGKTTLIRSLTAILGSLGQRVLLAAPTGRAARRLAEVTRRPAETIHKLLRYNMTTGLFDKNRDDPLDTHAIIIDEASMIDTHLMFHLLQALRLDTMLVLVGDVHQLPSVGPGNVLDDMIRSGRIKTFELTEIFRQSDQSAIITNAHQIRKGYRPERVGSGDLMRLSDFTFIEQAQPDKVVQIIVDLCRKEIPAQYKLEAVRDIQVVCPMHKGTVGTVYLNKILQEALNPVARRVEIMGSRYALGDKVMHLKNNYQKDVFNGDIGTIQELNLTDEKICINYDGRAVTYDFAELDEVSLAYAISVHKSQGSEYPAVVIPLLTQHYALLQRNLLYTAVTRGSRLVTIVGTTKALAIALQNDRPRQRLSGLKVRLQG
jgi:exodeoxyribonuclease V alpha subunit